MKYAVAILFFIAPLIVAAHGTGGVYETFTGEYRVDVDYSTPAPVVGESISFNFQLSPKEKPVGTDVPFTGVWVRIEAEDGTLYLASGLHKAQFGGARMTYLFSKTGTYTISARYETETGSLAEASFPLTVLPLPRKGIPDDVMLVGIGLIAGVFLGFIFRSLLWRFQKVS